MSLTKVTAEGLGALNDVNLEAYNNTSTITGNAVDIFIYDTSKDSDGGAWRKRTQDTSWYNEAASTTRGSRKDFPAVAVIVAESNKVTIYDGDTPDLDMWMVISAGGIIDWATSTQTRIAVSALNGIVTTVTGDGGHLFGFVKDYVDLMYYGSYTLTSSRTIAGRNDTSSFVSGGGDSYIVVHYAMNDVAMTVLPNAPIDSATGLPIPTILVGTDSGVSLISDSGSVYDIVATTGSDTISSVAFIDNELMITNSDSYVYRFTLPTVDSSTAYYTQSPNFIYRLDGTGDIEALGTPSMLVAM